MLLKVLEKLNIPYEQLTADEKSTLERWQTGLNTSDFTLDNLKEFLKREIDRLSTELLNFDNDPVKDLSLKMRIRNYRMIASFIEAPDKIREQAKKQIAQNTKVNL